MRYLSVCSGIEAASVGWEPLGWSPVAFAEIEPFPSAVLAHRFPNTPNLGDFTKIGKDDVGAIDLLVGGTPCQDFSVAGLRAGLAGDRGALTIEFLHLARRLRPEWLVWENVPGVLSADGGRAFGTFLGLLGKLGYGFSYRILDARHFGVPQRRRRVFVVGCLGDWRRASQVLFDKFSLSGNPPPRRKAGQIAPTLPSRSSAGGGLGTDFDCDGGLIAGTLMASGAGMERPAGMASETDFLVAHTLRAEGFDASEDGTGRGVPLVPVVYQDSEFGVKKYDTVGTLRAGREPHHQMIAFTCKDGGGDAGDDISPTLRSMHHLDGGRPNGGGQVAIAFGGQSDPISSIECAQPVTTRNEQPGSVAITFTGDTVFGIGGLGSAVRRLTPRQRECERLMGFPDDWTLVPYRGKPASDGPRYRSLGNSFAVPVIRWIGERIGKASRAT